MEQQDIRVKTHVSQGGPIDSKTPTMVFPIFLREQSTIVISKRKQLRVVDLH